MSRKRNKKRNKDPVEVRRKEEIREDKRRAKQKRTNRRVFAALTIIATMCIVIPYVVEYYEQWQIEEMQRLEAERKAKIERMVQLEPELKQKLKSLIFTCDKKLAELAGDLIPATSPTLGQVEVLRQAETRLEIVVALEREVEPRLTVERAKACLAKGQATFNDFFESDNPFEQITAEDKAWGIATHFLDALGCRYIPPGKKDGEGVEEWMQEPYAGLFSSLVFDNVGTCASMPIAIDLEAELYDFPVYLVNANRHVFNIWRDEGKEFHIETTSGDSKRAIGNWTQAYKRDLAGQELAIERGIFLRPLTARDEYIAHIFKNRSQFLILRSMFGTPKSGDEFRCIRDWAAALYLDPRNVWAASGLGPAVSKYLNDIELHRAIVGHIRDHCGLRGDFLEHDEHMLKLSEQRVAEARRQLLDHLEKIEQTQDRAFRQREQLGPGSPHPGSQGRSRNRVYPPQIEPEPRVPSPK